MAIADARFPSLSLVDVNSAFERLSGFTALEILGHDLRLLEGTRSDSDAMNRSARLVIEGQSPQIVVLHYRKDGSTFWNEITMSPVRGDRGHVTHVVALLRDVTERQQLADLQAALADLSHSTDSPASERDLIVHAATAMVFRFADHCGVFVCGGGNTLSSAYVARSEQFFKEPRAPAPAAELVAGRVKCIAEDNVVDSSDPAFQSALHASAQHGFVWVPIRSHQQTLGCMKIRRLSPYAALDATGTAVLQRIGTRLGVDLERDRLLHRAHASIASRDQFLSVASHELRTPVASIKGHTQLLSRSLERGTLTEVRLRRGLETMTTSIHRLTGLMDDLLDVSRLGNADVPIHREPFEIDAFVRDVVLRTALIVPQVLDLQSMSPGVWIMCDRVKLKQVLDILIGNASRYSEAETAITIATTPSGEGVLLTVADHGVGVSEDDLDRIFDAFARSRDAIASETAGLGLGLFICRSIVERHGGKVWAEHRNADEGTVLNVWLPSHGQRGIEAGDSVG